MTMRDLRTERLRRGWTQGKLSALTGIASSDISALEHGRHLMTSGWRRRLARALQIPDGDMLASALNNDRETPAVKNAMDDKKRSPAPNDWLTIPEARLIHGFGDKFIYDQIRRGKLRAARVGKSYRLHRRWIDEWLEASSTSVVDVRRR